MSIINSINYLPYELRDKIYNYYWSNIFYEKVIKHFKMLNKYINKINSFIVNIFLKAQKYEGDTWCYHQLCATNAFLKKVRNDKSSFLYLKGNCKNVKYLKTYKEYMYKHISCKLRLVTFYIVSFSNSMRFIIYDRFVNITSNCKNL